jgi:hypothetical protein
MAVNRVLVTIDSSVPFHSLHFDALRLKFYTPAMLTPFDYVIPEFAQQTQFRDIEDLVTELSHQPNTIECSDSAPLRLGNMLQHLNQVAPRGSHGLNK